MSICDATKNTFSDALSFLEFVRRVAPIRETIPRLELVAAVTGTGSLVSTKQELKIDIVSYYWSNSATVLIWVPKTEVPL